MGGAEGKVAYIGELTISTSPFCSFLLVLDTEGTFRPER